MKYAVTVDDETYIIEINQEGQVLFGDLVLEVDFAQVGDGDLYSLLVNNESFEALAEDRGGLWRILMRGNLYDVRVVDERTQRLTATAKSLVPETGEVSIQAPMPGLVISVPVSIGQQIEAGDKLVILESMKMENELKAPRDGTVERINVRTGESVEQNQTLVVIV